MTVRAAQEGRGSLSRSEWAVARRSFEEAIEAGDTSPEVLDGLGQALWWLRDYELALQVRARAVAVFRDQGDYAQAVRIAVWLARENRELYGNDVVADGWLSTAEECQRGVDDPGARGWLFLARAERSRSAPDVTLAEEAVAAAREAGDRDLEVTALGVLGVSQVGGGEVDRGLEHLDHAMAIASAGTTLDPRSFGEACCALVEAAGLIGDTDRLMRWSQAISSYLSSFDYPPLRAYGSPTSTSELSTFCGACCGGIYLVSGRVDEAETELAAAIKELQETGMRSRCVHPVTQLAELRIVQGRLEEARALLEEHADLPEAVRPIATLDLALGDPERAATRLWARLDELSQQPVLAFALWALLVDVALARGDIGEAERAARALDQIQRSTRSRRHEADVLFARGKVRAAMKREDAPGLLRLASKAFADVKLPLPAARARFALASSVAGSDPGVAVAEGRAAAAAFERLGATVDADAAAAFLRSLGVKGRTGPKDLGRLTKREQEVLSLLAQGLSNAEISGRLFISVKTAGHHVSNILAKLNVRSRTEAAAFAALNLPRDRTRDRESSRSSPDTTART